MMLKHCIRCKAIINEVDDRENAGYCGGCFRRFMKEEDDASR